MKNLKACDCERASDLASTSGLGGGLEAGAHQNDRAKFDNQMTKEQMSVWRISVEVTDVFAS